MYRLSYVTSTQSLHFNPAGSEGLVGKIKSDAWKDVSTAEIYSVTDRFLDGIERNMQGVSTTVL